MNVMITGVSRGIGYETVRQFLRMNGINVYAVSRSRDALKHLMDHQQKFGNGSEIIPIEFDIRKLSTSPVLAADFIPAGLSHIDILINNAGFLVNKPFHLTVTEEISQMFDINCIAPGLLIKLLLPFMGKESKTHIVNIGSMGGFQGSMKFAGLEWYSAAKAALICLTECLSESYKNSGIVFNCLALGSVQTEMLQEAFPGYKAPLKPEEMAEFIADFALNAHRYMRGKVIPVSLTNP